MKKLLAIFALLLAPLGFATAQTVGIVDGATPIVGGSTGQCVTKAANGTVTMAACTASGAVNSFSGGSTGLTPSSPTTGTVTLSGVLATANGGFGVADHTCQATTITSTGATSYAVVTSATRYEIWLWGAGGGGGSGRRSGAGIAASGGFGGAGTIPVSYIFPASSLTFPITVTIGTHGNGGAAQTADSTDGNPGTDGGATTFGSYLKSFGGKGASAVSTVALNGTTQGSTGIQATGNVYPIATSITANLPQTGIADPRGGAAGGTGGGISTGNVAFQGIQSAWSGWIDPALAAPTGPAATGGTGANGNNSSVAGIAGYGGGGGGASTSAVGGDGGTGARGSGGGGGGASRNGNNSGKGGDGGDGMAYVLACFN